MQIPLHLLGPAWSGQMRQGAGRKASPPPVEHGLQVPRVHRVACVGGEPAEQYPVDFTLTLALPGTQSLMLTRHNLEL